MRRIKFRSWFEDEMLGHEKLVYMDQETHAMYTIITNEKCEEGIVFMQYTGLKDCEGNEIYEGDILEFNDNASARSGGFKEDKTIKGYVIFEEGMYKLHDYENLYDLYEVLINDEESKVIGNIYESGE